MSHDDAAYWRACAIWMADVHAANAQSAAAIKRTSKFERRRQAKIAKECADLLMRKAIPQRYRAIESIADRCLRAAEECSPAGTGGSR